MPGISGRHTNSAKVANITTICTELDVLSTFVFGTLWKMQYMAATCNTTKVDHTHCNIVYQLLGLNIGTLDSALAYEI